jgi:sporulation protein YlmC with PRC-barrel domain
MDLYVILRRNGWRSPEELEEAAKRSSDVGDQRGDVRWIRSYVLDDSEGLGTVCIYEGESEDAIRQHASESDLPVDEVVKVADTVIVRPDPEPAAAS